MREKALVFLRGLSVKEISAMLYPDARGTVLPGLIDAALTPDEITTLERALERHLRREWRDLLLELATEGIELG